MRSLFLSTLIIGAVSYDQEPSVYAISKAIAQIETGENYKGQKGEAGEVGKYQILPVVLRERGCSPTGDYRDFQRVYSYFRGRTETWQDACKAYHRGLGGIHKKAAKDYAQRVANLVDSMSQ